jgi:GNAT superfamily N-acetyltransferase
MSTLQIRDIQPQDERFVASCTHVSETKEWDASCQRRIPWLREMQGRGLRVKVALLDGQHAGFLYLFPIEIAPGGPVGRDLSAIQCLTVRNRFKGRGVGGALIAAAEQEARAQGKKGIVVTAFYHDFWFMPASFFEARGFVVARRRDDAALLWKVYDAPTSASGGAQAPEFLERRYRFEPVEGKVVIDLFWSRSCLTTDTEAERVREVTAEYGDAVLLREYRTDDPVVRDRYGIYRAIMIDGQEVSGGYEAPKEGLREAIRRAME